jgi:hypothetical protein
VIDQVGHYIAGMPWNSRLRHPIPLADSRVLRTLADARDMVLSLPKRDQQHEKWQTLAALASQRSTGRQSVAHRNRRSAWFAMRLADHTQNK